MAILVNFIKTKWKWIVVILLSLFLVASFFADKVSSTSEQEKLSQAAREQAEAEIAAQKGTVENLDQAATDKLLLQSQASLEKSFGKPPEGFIWSMSGKAISLGDKSMEPEDVVYTYLQSLSKLTIDTAEFLSRDSDVVKTYKNFYSETYNASGDYKDEFDKEIYKLSMMSLEILGVENTAVFAQNKNTYTVKARMIDLGNKDFWKSDEEKFFEQLYYLDTNESDSAKKDSFIYNTILQYYKGKDVKKKEITFEVTVERYPDLNSGWLVSSDQALDSAFKYKDGNEVVNYIDQLYQKYKLNRSIKEGR